MSKYAPRILRSLHRRAGEKIKVRELQKSLADAPSDSGGKARKGRRNSGGGGGGPNYEELEEFLAELAELGAVHLEPGVVIPNDPFLVRGKVSLSPRGMAFCAIRGATPDARDVFVAPQDTRGALPGDEVLIRLQDKKRERFEGSVLTIKSRAREYFRLKLLGPPRSGAVVGVLLDTPGRITACLDVRRMATDTQERLNEGVVLVVRLSGDHVRYQGASFQEAFFERFEDDTDLDADFARILLKYNLRPDYPPEIPLPEPEQEQPSPKTVKDWKDRKDLRELYTITIDGADTKDFDDALSIEIGKSRWKLYVHIADVSYYVPKGSALDEEARNRATSYYLANRVIPMLPPALSEDLCSLVAGVDRLAFTAEMEVDPKDGKILKGMFYKSVIRVDRRLTYKIAEAEMDAELRGDEPAQLIEDGLRPDGTREDEPTMLGRLWELAQVQRKRRMESGRIDLDMPESKIKVGKDDKVESIEYNERLKSSMLIEECMLSANITVAQFLRKSKANTLFRIHETMDDTKILGLNAFFASYNIPAEIKDTSYAQLKKAMQIVRGHVGGERIEHVFTILLLRSFQQAKYSPEPMGHWGLAFPDYCHFTSPIRRYPDLVVHRSLQALLAPGKKKKRSDSYAYKRDEVEELGIHCSEQERKAMEAERDTFRLKIMRYVQQQNLRKFRGFVTGFKSDRVFVELAGMPAEAVVEASHLTDDRELPTPDKFSVFVKRLGRPALLGEEWFLELDRVDVEEMRIYCKPVWSRDEKGPRPIREIIGIPEEPVHETRRKSDDMDDDADADLAAEERSGKQAGRKRKKAASKGKAKKSDARAKKANGKAKTDVSAKEKAAGKAKADEQPKDEKSSKAAGKPTKKKKKAAAKKSDAKSGGESGEKPGRKTAKKAAKKKAKAADSKKASAKSGKKKRKT